MEEKTLDPKLVTRTRVRLDTTTFRAHSTLSQHAPIMLPQTVRAHPPRDATWLPPQTHKVLTSNAATRGRRDDGLHRRDALGTGRRKGDLVP